MTKEEQIEFILKEIMIIPLSEWSLIRDREIHAMFKENSVLFIPSHYGILFLYVDGVDVHIQYHQPIIDFYYKILTDLKELQDKKQEQKIEELYNLFKTN